MTKMATPVLDRLVDPVSRILTAEVARDLVKLRFDPQTQKKIAKLARKCNEGKLTNSERAEYEACVSFIDFIALLQAKARRLLKQTLNHPRGAARGLRGRLTRVG